MAEERSIGLILRTRPLTETSLIVHWLTPDLGRVATVAKGARRPNSPFRGKLDLFYLAEFTFVRSRRSDLHNLREATVRETNPHLRADLNRLQQAAYFVAFIEQATEIDTPLPNVFQLMKEAIATLAQHRAEPLTVFAFELKMLAELGLSPDVEDSKLSAGTKQIVTKCAELPMDALSHLKLSEAQVRELTQFLQDFLVFHLGKLPTGRRTALVSE